MLVCSVDTKANVDFLTYVLLPPYPWVDQEETPIYFSGATLHMLCNNLRVSHTLDGQFLS